ncbi:hypothetical protein WBG78_30415 [Chryseolinea sp. T2]|uniref:hypothetical protein n=1 Tax=Chryseolinea sp. T2 TaxID=3129255 RepID=UPI00307724D4
MTRLLIILTIAVSTSWTTIDEGKLYDNYKKAIENESTFQYFVVIHVTDVNTGQTREICTKGNFLAGAIHREYNLGYDDNSIRKAEKIAINNRTRAFKFKSLEAINNLGLDRYSMTDLKEFEATTKIDQLTGQVNKEWKMRTTDDKEMLLYAHSFFNRGILTGENDCFGGTLEFVSK